MDQFAHSSLFNNLLLCFLQNSCKKSYSLKLQRIKFCLHYKQQCFVYILQQNEWTRREILLKKGTVKVKFPSGAQCLKTSESNLCWEKQGQSLEKIVICAQSSKKYLPIVWKSSGSARSSGVSPSSVRAFLLSTATPGHLIQAKTFFRVAPPWIFDRRKYDFFKWATNVMFRICMEKTTFLLLVTQ